MTSSRRWPTPDDRAVLARVCEKARTEPYRTALDPHQAEPTHPVPVAGLLTPVGVLLLGAVFAPAVTTALVLGVAGGMSVALCVLLLAGFVAWCRRNFPPIRDEAPSLIDNNTRSNQR